ncbi:MAG: hypothetical protein M1835_005935 [Candelina submexicana]|nr:MAG: hypothetical protein M1835_005935 [Candelina submexicana]
MSDRRALFVGNVHATRKAFVDAIKDAGFVVSEWSSRGGKNYPRIVFPNRREAQTAMNLLKQIQLPNGDLPLVKWHDSQVSSLPIVPWVPRVMPTIRDLEETFLTHLLSFLIDSPGGAASAAVSAAATSSVSEPAASPASDLSTSSPLDVVSPSALGV